jgi:NitT/TauT family transport system permease protein
MMAVVALPSRVRSGGRIIQPLTGLAPIAILLVLWQVLGDPASPIFPPPSEWWTAFVLLVQSGVLPTAFAATIVTFATALLAATVIGAILGALTGSSRRLDRTASPLLTFLMCVPPPAIVPVFILVLGVGFGTQVAAVVFAAVWPILLNTASAMRSIPAVRLESARLLGLGWSGRVRHVIAPSLVPGVALGVMVAAPICIVVTLLLEMLTSSRGAGSLLLSAQRSFQAAEMFALLVLIALLGLVVNLLISAGERLLTRNWPA